MNKDLMRGSVDILLLSLIAKQDTYGYEIVKKLKESSGDFYSMSEGTLYPALKRLEGKGWLGSYWGDADIGGRRKYYTITDLGRQELTSKLKERQEVSRLIQKNAEGLSWNSNFGTL